VETFWYTFRTLVQYQFLHHNAILKFSLLPDFPKRVTTIELKWLEDFLSLCDMRNFRLSAERRCVSQPAFSRRIKTLENWIGAKLIDRSVQPVELTSAGESFRPVALEIVHLAYQSRNNIYT
jgi:hypothetical protein